MPMGELAPLSWQRLLDTWRFPGLVTALVVAALLGYALGVALAHRRGRPWPWRRSVSLVAAATVTVVALDSAVDAYSMSLYWMHMVQHLLLIMAVPALCVLAEPWRLLRRCGRYPAAIVRHGLQGAVGRALTLPGVGLACYTCVLVGTHLTTFMYAMSVHMWLHPVEAAAYVLAGYLFLLPLLGNEPVPHRQGYLTRLCWLMLGMGVDAFVGVTLMMSTGEALSITGMRQQRWAPDPLTDLHTGGAVMWVGGSGLMLALVLLVAVAWIRDTGHRDDTGHWLTAARRHALHLDATADPEGEDALAAYNEQLRRLDGRSPD